MPMEMSLHDFLQYKGYQVLALERSKYGSLRIKGQLNREEAVFLLDTGASHTVIDLAFAKKAQLDMELSSQLGGGIGTTTAQLHRLALQEFTLSGFKVSDLELLAMDLGISNEAFLNDEDAPSDGILGTDFLEKYAAIIDYETAHMYVKPS